MANPARRWSKQRTRTRKAAWKVALPGMVACGNCGEYRMPHRVCPSCGQYNKMTVVNKDAE